VQIKQGLKIRHYVLDRKLGEGAFGDVWAANDGSKTVAIKFIHAEFMASNSATKYIKYLQNEAQILGHLEHPNIPTLYDYDIESAPPYLVMQYIDGDSYETLIATGQMIRISLEKRLRALEVIAATTATIHRNGIIHRDIKPSSINGIDTPYLLDFGIAIDIKDVGDAHAEIGTGIYMPPPDIPTGKLSDNYSLAIVAYEVLFGHHPIFTANNISKTVIENRKLAGVCLQNGQWRLPSKLTDETLPGNLTGANLGRLDEIFTNALSLPADNMWKFVADLAKAILIPENQPYRDAPSPFFAVQSFAAGEHYTDHEVKRENRDTDMQPDSSIESGSWQKILIAIIILIIIYFVVRIML
jgi:serine/threonine protein kinase